MKKNVFVVGYDDFHRKLLETVQDAERYNFLPLIDASEIVNPVDCRISEVLLSAKRILDGFDGSIDAIIGHWDFPTSTILPILREHCGLPGPSLETVLRCEHKYWSRVEQRKVIPEHVPRFASFDPFAENPRGQIDLDYPFWVKPVKAHSSFLGFKVADDAEFAHAIDEFRAHLKIMALPFNEILERADVPLEIAEVDGWHCIAEEIISADMQCTVEGYALNGTVRGYGYIDSERAGRHGSTFVRYHYPSRLPEAVHGRIEEIARAFLHSIEFDMSPFNMEFFHDEETGRLSLVEVNPRISKSHCPIFHLVDGASHHQIAVRTALGEEPDYPFREGDFPHAAKFMMRHLGADAFVRHVPQPLEFDRLHADFPELRMNLHVREGLRLSDMALQEPYSYELADIFLGGESMEDVQERYERLCAMMPIDLKPLSAESLEEHRAAVS
ncbi:MAG TPA: hypothetical protein VHG92_14565 [Afifellaceae bacterium]|nr:hypothetical protein [Afifellaceae bacterium]